MKCYDCLSEDVAVKIIDLCGFEHWMCAECWQANREFAETFAKRLNGLLDEMAATS